MTEDIDVVFKEPKTFKQMLKPLNWFCWLMGAGAGRIGGWKKCSILIRLFHFTVCSVVIAYGIIDFFTIGNILPSEMFKIMYYMNKAVTYVTSYYYVFLGVIHKKSWEKFIERIDHLDRKIRRETSFDDRSTKVKQSFALGLTILMGPISAVSHILYYKLTDPTQIFTSDLLVYYTIAQSLISNFWFDVVVSTVHQRFKIVNKLIKQIGDSYAAPWIVLKIQRLRELHHEICGLVSIVNKVHGTHLLLSSANSFMMVLATLFRIYIGVVELNFGFIMINNVIWIVYATQFALNCFVCTFTCREATSTGILIHEVGLKNNQLTNKRLYNNTGVHNNRRSLSYQPEAKTYEGSCVQNEIAHFSSQLQQNRVSFSACHFFELNNALLQGFVGVITTYLIILIQFYQPDRKSTNLGLTASMSNTTEPFDIYNSTAADS
ncbi:putative gustatory receptor 28b [Diprion similis]|uniref:putative gustatory receptor 28b n=1 Tax=Diprion similis TaxID=362088 RepID=UPI001EF9AF67|nr:putative gustatory receptor 28b [Diprion similis]